MKLRFSPTSPYVRKVLATAHEAGIVDRIEKVPTDVMGPKSDLGRDNPLGKVPALILGDGTVLFDSPVICEYLDAEHGGGRLLPESGPERWKVLRQQALGDGILDAAVASVFEGKRDPQQRSDHWLGRWRAAITRALDDLEARADDLAGPPTLGQIAVGCALGYLDFRKVDEAWRSGRPGLSAWYEQFSKRPSMQASVAKE